MSDHPMKTLRFIGFLVLRESDLSRFPHTDSQTFLIDHYPEECQDIDTDARLRPRSYLITAPQTIFSGIGEAAVISLKSPNVEFRKEQK